MHHSAEIIYAKGKRLIGIGLFLIVLFGASGFSLLSEGNVGSALMGFFFAALGLYQVYRGYIHVRGASAFGDYLHALQIIPDNRLSTLAKKLKVTEKEASQRLRQMEKLRLFGSVLITNDGIIDIKDFSGLHLGGRIKTAGEKLNEMTSVRCKNCGAISTVRQGTAARCEYCDGLLNT